MGPGQLGDLTHAWQGDTMLLRATPGAGEDRTLVDEGAGFTVNVNADFEIEDGMALTHVRVGDRIVATQESARLAATLLTDLAPAQGNDVLTPEPNGIIDAGDGVVAGRIEADDVDLAGEGRAPTAARRLLRASLRRTLLEGTPRVVFHHRDRLGNTIVATDVDGGVIERTAWYPFGQPRVAPDGGRRGYQSRQVDDSTGLVFFGARYYDAALGRWMSPDPAFDSLAAGLADGRPREATNGYQYAFNSPITFEDLDGRTNWLTKIFRRESSNARPVSAVDDFLNASRQLQARNAGADRTAEAVAIDLADLQSAALASGSVPAAADTVGGGYLGGGTDGQITRQLAAFSDIQSDPFNNLGDTFALSDGVGAAPAAAVSSPLAASSGGNGRGSAAQSGAGASAKYKRAKKRKVSKRKPRKQNKAARKAAKKAKSGKK